MAKNPAKNDEAAATTLPRIGSREGPRSGKNPAGDRPPPYTETQTKRWLSWLAKAIQRQRQTVFMIEQLEPTWLSTRAERWTYLFTSRLVAGFLISQPLWWIFAKPGIAVIGLVAGLIFGLGLALADVVLLETRRAVRPSPTVPRYAGNVLFMVATLGLTCGVFFGPFLNLSHPAVEKIFAVGLILAMIWGIRVTRENLGSDIRTVETLTWSWTHAFRGAAYGLAFGAAVGLVWAIVDWFAKPFDYVLGGLAIGILVAPLVGAWAGLKQGIREVKTVPNQGIALTIRSSCFGALVIALIGTVWAVGGLSFKAIQGQPIGEDLLVEVVNVPCVALFFASFFGAFDVAAHYVLRFMLFMLGRAPLNYARFLDHAANDLGFLQKVGGGYIFIHRMLLEHFAAMEAELASEAEGNRSPAPDRTRPDEVPT